MAITKDEVAAKAKELGLTLIDAEIDQYVKDGKLPEKPDTKRYEEMRTELAKKTTSELIDLILDARSEAKDRRLENKTLKEQAEALTKEINAVKQDASKYPELESRFKTLETQLQAARDSEKKRREAIFTKLDEKKRSVIGYLLEVEKIGAEQFDATIELLITAKTNGAESPTPAGIPPTVQLTDAEKRDALRMGVAEADYKNIMEKRKSRAPITMTPQRPATPIM